MYVRNSLKTVLKFCHREGLLTANLAPWQVIPQFAATGCTSPPIHRTPETELKIFGMMEGKSTPTMSLHHTRRGNCISHSDNLVQLEWVRLTVHSLESMLGYQILELLSRIELETFRLQGGKISLFSTAHNRTIHKHQCFVVSCYLIGQPCFSFSVFQNCSKHC